MSENTQQLPAEQQAKEKKSFGGMLERMKPQLAAALPRHLSPERMMRVALTCYRMTPDLAKCSPESVIGAVVQCAQLGLEPGLLGQAYLLPFKKNKKIGNEWHSSYECQFIPGYKGLIALARRSGEVTAINTEIVYENDKFELTLGIDASVVHKPRLDGDRGKPKLVYGVAKFKDGGYHFEWMPIQDVEKIRQRSKAKDNGPWVTDYEQMVRKTVIRRMANYLPMSVELANAIAVSDAHDDGKRSQLVLEGDFLNVQTTDADEDSTPDKGTAGLRERVTGSDAQEAERQEAGKTESKGQPEQQAEPAQQKADPQPQQQAKTTAAPAATSTRRRPGIGSME